MAKLEAQPPVIQRLMTVKHSSGEPTSSGTPERDPEDTGDNRALLTRRDVDRLTAYKWRYALESHGFTAAQASRLLYVKWLYMRGTIGG